MQRALPSVPAVADLFRVIQDANRRVDEARRVEQEVTGQHLPRWLLVKNEERRTNKQAAQRAAIRKRHKNVAHFLHWVKEQLRDVYRATRGEEAAKILDWIILNTKETEDAAMVQADELRLPQPRD